MIECSLRTAATLSCGNMYILKQGGGDFGLKTFFLPIYDDALDDSLKVSQVWELFGGNNRIFDGQRATRNSNDEYSVATKASTH